MDNHANCGYVDWCTIALVLHCYIHFDKIVKVGNSSICALMFKFIFFKCREEEEEERKNEDINMKR